LRDGVCGGGAEGLGGVEEEEFACGGHVEATLVAGLLTPSAPVPAAFVALFLWAPT